MIDNVGNYGKELVVGMNDITTSPCCVDRTGRHFDYHLCYITYISYVLDDVVLHPNVVPVDTHSLSLVQYQCRKQ